MLKHTNIREQTLQVKDMIRLLENKIGGGISAVMGDRYVKSDEEERFCLLMRIICVVGL